MADIFDQVAGGDIFDQVSPGLAVGPAPAQFPGTGNALSIPDASFRPGRSTVALSDQNNQIGRAPSADIRDTAKSMGDDVVGTGGESWPIIAGKSAARGFFVVPKVIAEGGQLIRKSLDMPESGFRKGLKQVDELITPDVGESPLKNYASQAARTVSEMAGSGLSLPLMAVYSGSTKAGEIMDAGKSVPKALAGAAIQTALEYWTEKLPFEILQKPGLKFFERLGQGLVADVPGELIATAGEMSLIDQPILGKKYTADDYAKALLDTAIVSGLVTGGATIGAQAMQPGKKEAAPKEPSRYGEDPNTMGDIFDQVSLPPGSGPATALPITPDRPRLTSDRTAGEGFTMAPSPGIDPTVAKNAEIDQLVSGYQPEAPTTPAVQAQSERVPFTPSVVGGAAPTISDEAALDILDARGVAVNQSPGETIKRPGVQAVRPIGPIGQVILKKVHTTEAGANKALNNRIEKGQLAADEYGVFPVDGGFQIQTVPVEQRAAREQARAEAASRKQAGIVAGEVTKADPIYSIIQEAKRNPINLEALERDYPDFSKEIVKKYPGILKRGGKVQPDEFAEENGHSLDSLVEALKAAQPMSQSAPVKLEQDNAHFEELRQAGFVPVGDTMIAGSFQKGDVLVGTVNGVKGEYTVQGRDSKGMVVIGEDRIDLFDEVQVEYLKQGTSQEDQDYQESITAPVAAGGKINQKRTFEPQEVSTDKIPESIKGEKSVHGGGRYFHATAEELQAWLEKNGDGWLYRRTEERGVRDGLDKGKPGYMHQFPTFDAKVHSFTSNFEEAKGLLKGVPNGILYKIRPADISAEFTIQISDGTTGVIHAQSPLAAEESSSLILYRRKEWFDDAGRTPQAESADRGRDESPVVDELRGTARLEEGEVSPIEFVSSLPEEHQTALRDKLYEILDSEKNPAQKIELLQAVVDGYSKATPEGAIKAQPSSPPGESATKSRETELPPQTDKEAATDQPAEKTISEMTPAELMRVVAEKLEAAEKPEPKTPGATDKASPSVTTGGVEKERVTVDSLKYGHPLQHEPGAVATEEYAQLRQGYSGDPLIVTADGFVLDGNGRLANAKADGQDGIEVIRIPVKNTKLRGNPAVSWSRLAAEISAEVYERAGYKQRAEAIKAESPDYWGGEAGREVLVSVGRGASSAESSHPPTPQKDKGGEIAPAVPIKPRDVAAEEREGQARRENPNIKTTLATHNETLQRVEEGKATLAEYKAGFERLMNSLPEIEAEFAKMSKPQIFAERGGYFASRHKADKKDSVVRSAMLETIGDFNLSNSLSFDAFGKNYFESHNDAVRRKVEEATEESLKAYADRVQARVDERKARAEQDEEAIKDPQTLEDYKTFFRAKMGTSKSYKEAYREATPEQRATFDFLASAATRAERVAALEKKRTSVQVAGQTTGAVIVEGEHSKHHYPIWSVQLADKVDGDSYKTLLSTAKSMGGNYVNTMQARMWKTIWGFQFRDQASAEAFLKLAAGDTTEAQEKIKERRDSFADDRSQSAVERLTEMAERLDDRADDTLSADRKVNTARRAGMAANAEANANREKAMAQTMRNIADAIDDGSAKMLDQVRQKVQVELLQSYANRAHYEQLREKYPAYIDYERNKDSAPDTDTPAFVEFPQYTAYRSDLAKLGRQLQETPGAKKLGASLLKVADDVTDTYLKFAKENLGKVSTFTSRETGALATFKTKLAAEESIDRSGYRGKAIVLPFKRNENLIILSPTEAKERGVWDGDSDKRITLRPDFGAEIVAKVKAMGRRQRVDMPWMFETAHTDRGRLAAMGLETPAELRAALREFINLREAPKQASKIKELERAMIGRVKDGLDFFPTPASVASEMVKTAGITEGMKVLEPSAGMGHIAEQVREAGVEPDVIEMGQARRELLEAKGFNVVGRDFLDLTEGGYDRIVMNPPFSDRRDSEHVQHAFTLLNPGGRIVAIMGEGVFFGQDKKAVQFREWLESVGGTAEKLDEGTFLDPSLPVNTATNARMVVIDKPAAGEPLYSESYTQPTGNTVSKVRKEIVEAYGDISGLEALGLVNIVSSESGLPDKAIKFKGYNGISGAYIGGRVWIVADTIEPGGGAGVFLHEVAHRLLESGEVFAEQKAAILAAFARLDGNAAKAARARVPADAGLRPGETSRELSAIRRAEVAAHRADEELTYFLQSEAGKKSTLWRRVVFAVRSALRRLGLKIKNSDNSAVNRFGFEVKFSENDLIQMFVRGAKEWVRSEEGAANHSEDVRGMVPAFSESKKDQREAFQERVIAAQDFADEAKSVGRRVKVNSDGTVTLYHGTAESLVEKIKGEGLQRQSFLSLTEKETADHIKQHKQTAVIAMKVDARDVSFSGGTQEVYAEEGLVFDRDSGIWSSPKRTPALAGSNVELKAVDTESPDFLRWFGKSKVVDAEGNPLRVFHSSRADITGFSSKPGNDLGFHFGNKIQANERLKSTRGLRHVPGEGLAQESGERVYPVYLAINNPLRVEDPGFFSGEDEDFVSQLNKAGILVALGEPDQDVIGKIQAAGYDGLVYKNESESDMVGFFAQDSYAAFSPTQIKSALSNSGAFNPASSDIRYSKQDKGPLFSKTKGFGDISEKQAEALKRVGGITEPKTIAEWWVETKDRAGLKLTAGIADQFAAIKEVLGEREYKLARMSKGTEGPLEAMMMFGDLYLDGDTENVDASGGIVKALQKLQGEQHRFFWWIAANRAEKLTAEERENLFSEQDITELKKLNAGKMPDGSFRSKVYREVLRDYTRASKNILDIAEQSGIINGDTRSAWEDDMYVPFYRATEDGITGGRGSQGGLTRQYGFKQLKGGTRKLHEDLFANVLMNWMHLLDASAKNRAARAALNKAKEIGIAEYVGESPKGKDNTFYLGRYTKILPEGTAYTEGGVEKVSDGTTPVEFHGKKYFRVDDPLVFEALEAIEFTGFNSLFFKVAGKFKNMLTMGVTASPTFKVRNLIRDSMAALAQNPMSLNPVKAAGNLAGGINTMRKKDQAYASLLAGRGLIRFGTILDGTSSRHMDKLINSGVEAGTIVDTKEKMADMLTAMADWYNELGDISEGANRASLYNQMIGEGKTHAEAAFASRDMLDFNLHGTAKAVRFLTQVVPFFNARVQGLYKMARAGKADPARMGAVIGAAALASVLLMLAYKDDEEWKKREDWDRDNYWWFKIGNTAWRIPKPFEVGVMATLAERGAEVMADDEMTGKRFAERLWAAVTQTLAMNPVPQMFKPLVDLYADKDSFTGRDIEGAALERREVTERYRSRTSETAKLASKAGQAVTQTVGADFLSPVQVDHLVRGYFGWLGTSAVTATDYMGRLFSDEPVRPKMTLRETFLAGSFVETLPSGSSRYLTEFYDQAKEVQQAYASMMSKRKEGDWDQAEKINEREGWALKGLNSRATKTQNRLSDISSQIREIERDRSPSWTSEGKREEIDRLTEERNRLAKMTAQEMRQRRGK